MSQSDGAVPSVDSRCNETTQPASRAILELLDWLAGWFRYNGYQLKALHRLIVTSETYRQSARASATALQVDRDNRLLWRFSPRRVEGEVLRDSLLYVSNALNTSI